MIELKTVRRGVAYTTSFDWRGRMARAVIRHHGAEWFVNVYRFGIGRTFIGTVAREATRREALAELRHLAGER